VRPWACISPRAERARHERREAEVVQRIKPRKGDIRLVEVDPGEQRAIDIGIRTRIPRDRARAQTLS
jgi:hypothetical protein